MLNVWDWIVGKVFWSLMVALCMWYPILPYSPTVGKEEMILEVHCFIRFMLVLNFKEFKSKKNMASFPSFYPNLNYELHSEV